MNTCDAIMERKMFVFSLVSSSFSLCVRAVREHHLGPRAPLDSEKQSTSHMQWTQSLKGPAKLAMRLEGGEVVVPQPAAASPGRRPQSLWPSDKPRALPPLSTPLPKFEPFYL